MGFNLLKVAGKLGKIAKVATGVAPALEVAETAAKLAGQDKLAKTIDKVGDAVEVAVDPVSAALSQATKKGK